LHADEYIEFARPNEQHSVRLTKETRRKLVLASHVREFTEDIIVRGCVPEADQDSMTFELQIINGPKITGPIPEQHLEIIVEAFVGYQNGKRILVQGVGRYNRQNRLTGMASIEHITFLDPLDVPARLDEFRCLKKGWLEGTGEPPPKAGLDWLAAQFSSLYPDDVELPHVYPTEEGDILAEWSLGGGEASLDIDLAKKTGVWHWLDTKNEQEDEQEFNLESPDAWNEIAGRLRQLGGVQA